MRVSRERLARIKTALRSLPGTRASIDANSEGLALLMDLESFISYTGPGGLTRYQNQVLRAVVFEGYTETEVGTQLEVSQQAIHYALAAALTKVSEFLENPKAKMPDPVFSREDIKRLKQLYKENLSYKEIAIVLHKKLRSVQNKIRYLQGRDELDGQKQLRSKIP